jgi:hypothetical protein
MASYPSDKGKGNKPMKSMLNEKTRIPFMALQTIDTEETRRNEKPLSSSRNEARQAASVWKENNTEKFNRMAAIMRKGE